METSWAASVSAWRSSISSTLRTILLLGTLYHNIGLIVAIFLPVIADTGISYFIPTLQFLARPTIWLRVIADYKVNITAAPNSAYEVCTRLISPEEAKSMIFPMSPTSLMAPNL